MGYGIWAIIGRSVCDGCEKKRTFVSMNERHIDINEFDYDLPDGRIAKFPLAERLSLIHI